LNTVDIFHQSFKVFIEDRYNLRSLRIISTKHTLSICIVKIIFGR